MNLEEFMTLTPEEQAVILTDRDSLTAQVDDLTAERNSLTAENTDLTNKVKTLTEEVAKIKESNFTLTRRLNLDNDGSKDPELLIKEMFMN